MDESGAFFMCSVSIHIASGRRGHDAPVWRGTGSGAARAFTLLALQSAEAHSFFNREPGGVGVQRRWGDTATTATIRHGGTGREATAAATRAAAAATGVRAGGHVARERGREAREGLAAG